MVMTQLSILFLFIFYLKITAAVSKITLVPEQKLGLISEAHLPVRFVRLQAIDVETRTR